MWEPVRSFVAVAGVHLFFHCCNAPKGDPMVAGFLLVEPGLWLGGRLMRSHMEAAGAREEL